MVKHFLEIENLARRFPSAEGELTVFENANFGIEKGEFVCIIGHSGCGKSTIMNVLAGLDAPGRAEMVVPEPLHCIDGDGHIHAQRPVLLDGASEPDPDLDAVCAREERDKSSQSRRLARPDNIPRESIAAERITVAGNAAPGQQQVVDIRSQQATVRTVGGISGGQLGTAT